MWLNIWLWPFSSLVWSAPLEATTFSLRLPLVNPSDVLIENID
jgi:hypothetical protein